MKRLLAIVFLGVSLTVRAHVGSPNVFFDGKAGEYSVHAVIRPPNVVPGLAEISVRVEAEGVKRVSVLPIFWATGRNGAPPADNMTLVHGETNLYTATLWLMKPGGYSVEVGVEGTHGGGAAMVPVNAVATNTQGMSTAFALMLAVLASLLFLGAVRIAGAIFSESLLAPGEVADAARIRRGRIAMVITAIGIVLALWGGKKWWDFKEAEYRLNTLYQPAGLTASVTQKPNQNLLELQITARNDPDQSPELIPDHGKLMHLFLVREPDLNVFAHLHPVKRSWQKFEVALPPLPTGRYAVYADITHETAFAETLTASVELPAPSAQVLQLWGGSNAMDQICGTGLVRAAPPEGFPLPPDPDDSWHVNRETKAGKASNTASVDGGRSIVWLPPGDLIENRDLSLRFQLMDANGTIENLEPYIGMFGHAAVRRDDGAVFAHIHPAGTFSMAAQEYFSGTTNKEHAQAEASHPVREVSFPFAFPSPGAYHLWIQLKSGGRAYTGVFEAIVKSAP